MEVDKRGLRRQTVGNNHGLRDWRTLGGGTAADEEGAFTGALAKTIGRPFGSNISSLVNREPHVRGDPEDKDISNSCGSHKRMAVFSETMNGMYSLPRACKELQESRVIKQKHHCVGKS